MHRRFLFGAERADYSGITGGQQPAAAVATLPGGIRTKMLAYHLLPAYIARMKSTFDRHIGSTSNRECFAYAGLEVIDGSFVERVCARQFLKPLPETGFVVLAKRTHGCSNDWCRGSLPEAVRESIRRRLGRWEYSPRVGNRHSVGVTGNQALYAAGNQRGVTMP